MIGDRRYTPNQLETDALAILAELVPLRDAEKRSGKRKALGARIKSARILLSFARTRAGYEKGGRTEA